MPQTFMQLMAGVLSILALLCAFISLKNSLRAHALKLSALLFIISMSMFSNHWATYFASIFIIATAITELDFLQNLAAIIRGNKDYFDYKKETLSVDQMKDKIRREQDQFAVSNQKPVKPDDLSFIVNKSRTIDFDKILAIESKALDRMEQYYGEPIKRGVRIKSRNAFIELDGIIPSVLDDVYSEKLFEVKYFKNKQDLMHRISELFPQMESLARNYCHITNKIAKLHIVLVVDGSESLSNEELGSLKRIVDSSPIALGYTVLKAADLGLDQVT